MTPIFFSLSFLGVCGEIYRRYVEHCGKSSERSNWKCKRYIKGNRVYCRCGAITDEQAENAFITAANHLIDKMPLLERKPKPEMRKSNQEFVKLNQQVKALEDAGRYSAKNYRD